MAVDCGEVTAIATWILAIGLLGGIGAAVFAAQQVRTDGPEAYVLYRELVEGLVEKLRCALDEPAAAAEH